MTPVTFKNWSWPENPEQMEIQTHAEPIYTVDADGVAHFSKMGDLSRSIEMKGVFHGAGAYDDFRALDRLIAEGTAGELSAPVLGKTTAYLTRVHMDQESRENYVVYAVTFRQTDESGGVPPLIPQGNIR